GRPARGWHGARLCRPTTHSRRGVNYRYTSDGSVAITNGSHRCRHESRLTTVAPYVREEALNGVCGRMRAHSGVQPVGCVRPRQPGVHCGTVGVHTQRVDKGTRDLDRKERVVPAMNYEEWWCIGPDMADGRGPIPLVVLLVWIRLHHVRKDGCDIERD